MTKKEKEKVKVLTHGLDRGQMLARHQHQTNGTGPKLIPANGPEAKGYKIDAQEAHLVHVLQGVRQFDQNTGQPLETPAPQVYTVPIFKQMKEAQAFAGMVITVLHSPEFAKEELGEAAEGTRVVDTNYAAMQEKYEGITGTKPKEHWTLAQLETAIEMAEDLREDFLRNQKQIPTQDATKAPAHTAPSLSTPDTAAPIKTLADVASEAAKAGDAAAQTNDGINHGTQMAGRGEDGTDGEGGDKGESDAGDADKAKDAAALNTNASANPDALGDAAAASARAAAQGESGAGSKKDDASEAASGRRGALPITAPKPPTAAQKKAAEAASKAADKKPE